MKRMLSGIILAFLLISLLPLTLEVRLFGSEKAISTEVSALGSFWAGTDWNRTYGGAYTDYANSVIQTSDGGYAMAGFTNSWGAGSRDFWLVKTDSAGNMQWNKTYGGTDRDEAYSVVQTYDYGYAVAGFTRSFGVGCDFWLVKTDSSGNALWNKTYGGPSVDGANAIVHTSLDGGYAIATSGLYWDTEKHTLRGGKMLLSKYPTFTNTNFPALRCSKCHIIIFDYMMKE